jgi:hypothetical protein
MKTIALTGTLGILLTLSLHANPAQAASRTWVSSGGGGMTCSRASPCANFQTAHDATDDNGEINCIDNGDFGTVAIAKGITIDCTGTLAAITSPASATGISVNAVGKIITLRGLTITGSGTGGAGIGFHAGTALHIENCRIAGFRGGLGVGIDFNPATFGVASRLHVSDSAINDNGLAASGGGINVDPATAASARVTLNRVRLQNNTHGVVALGTFGGGTVIVQVRDSAVTGSTGNGFLADTSSGRGLAAFVVDRSSIVTNAGSGLLAQSANALIHIGSSTVAGNGAGFTTSGSGQLLSYGNNQATGNGVEGAATGPLTVR